MIGKILGTIFGFMFGRIPGAVLGFMVGHMFDKGYSKKFNQTGGFNRFFASKDEFKTKAVFFHCLFSVMGHVAKADGKVSDVERRMASTLMDQMKLEGEVRKEAQQAFRDGKAEDFALKQTVQEFKESCHGRRDILQVYLEILIQAAYIDGKLDRPEQAILETVSQYLGFSQHDLLYLLSAFEAEIRFRQGGGGKQNTNGDKYSPQPSMDC